jgi:type IV secretory pathway TraG/TraD family ATPase VirD4
MNYGNSVAYKHFSGVHMMVTGMSRSGKTAGFVLGTIFSNANTEEKPCFIITDPKGELYELTNLYLKKLGYTI